MATLQATKVPIDVEMLAEAAKREPITIMNGNEEAFVVVAPDDFRRMAAAEHARRKEVAERLRTVLETIHRRVAAELTPEEIARLEREIIDED